MTDKETAPFRARQTNGIFLFFLPDGQGEQGRGGSEGLGGDLVRALGAEPSWRETGESQGLSFRRDHSVMSPTALPRPEERRRGTGQTEEQRRAAGPSSGLEGIQ